MVAYPPEPCGRCRLRPLMPAIMPAAGQGRLSESSALFRRLVRSVGGGEGGSGGVAPEAAVLHNVGLWLGTDARPGLPQGDGAGAEEEVDERLVAGLRRDVQRRLGHLPGRVGERVSAEEKTTGGWAGRKAGWQEETD